MRIGISGVPLNNENIPVYVFYGVDRYNEKTRKLRRRYTGDVYKRQGWNNTDQLQRFGWK